MKNNVTNGSSVNIFIMENGLIEKNYFCFDSREPDYFNYMDCSRIYIHEKIKGSVGVAQMAQKLAKRNKL